VSRALRAGARRWDAAALALVLAGAALYLGAGSGLRGVERAPELRATGEMVNLRRADNYRFISYAGLFLATAGIAVGVYSFLRARRPGAEHVT
jgi:hypothetical protein